MDGRFDSTELDDAVSSKRFATAELVKISLGCTNSTYSTKAACEAVEGEVWTDDILMATFANDIDADVGEGTETFFSDGNLLEVPEIEETLGMELSTITLELSAVSVQWLQLSQMINLHNRPVEIWKVIMDPDTLEIINAPFKVFTGVIVTGDIDKLESGDGGAIAIECSNQYYSYQQRRGFRCNVNDHQKFFPDDTGFEHVSSVPRTTIWGET